MKRLRNEGLRTALRAQRIMGPHVKCSFKVMPGWIFWVAWVPFLCFVFLYCDWIGRTFGYLLFIISKFSFDEGRQQ